MAVYKYLSKGYLSGIMLLNGHVVIQQPEGAGTCDGEWGDAAAGQDSGYGDRGLHPKPSAIRHIFYTAPLSSRTE